MDPYIISNAVPTPEEMAEILGVSTDRVDAVRRIMNAPVRSKSSSVDPKALPRATAKKSARSRTGARTTAKK